MFFKRRYHYKVIDSTSTFIKRRCLTLPNFSFVSADYQTNGRGRLGRVWNSNSNKNLMFSVLIKDKILVEKFYILSVCSALAVMKVLDKYGLKNVTVKWPNDVYVNDSKICGILLDGITRKGKLKNVIIGVGVNVNQMDFGDVLHTATSIKKELDIELNIDMFKKDVYSEFNNMFRLLRRSNLYFNNIVGRDYLKGKKVYAEIDGTKREVKVVGINSDATLKVSFDGVQKNLSTGEITFHI